MGTDGSLSAASEIEVGSIYPMMQELRAAAANKADTCVAGVAWCVMWRVEGVSPYVGICIGGDKVELWRIADWLKNDTEQLKVRQSRQLRCTLSLSGENRRNAF